METIYLHTIPQPRPSEKVVDLRAYQERKALLLDGAAVPALPVLPEITPERVELEASTEDALRHFLLWADAVASVVLIAGALLILAAVL